MDFDKYLKQQAKEVEKELEDLLKDWEREVKKFNPKLAPFAKGLINSTKGGKRIRGVLVKMGFEIAGKRKGSRGKGKEITKIAAAYEILHASLLIHDDIMDQSLTRRGKPSLYVALGNNHYGISQAINLGDIGLYLPIKIISDSSFPKDYKILALSFLSQVVINTGWGQVMDVALGEKGKRKGESEKDIKFINLNKTARYTIAAPLQIGAILNGANEKLLKVLGEFGENLGIAFQIQDNILDKEVNSETKAKQEALEFALKAEKVIPQLTKQSLPLQGKDPVMSKLLEQMCKYTVERTV